MSAWRHSRARVPAPTAGEDLVDAEHLPGPVLQAEALQAGRGEHHGVEPGVRRLLAVELVDAGADGAAYADDLKVRPDAVDLCLAAHGRGADQRAGREVVERLHVGALGDDQDVVHVAARQHCGEYQAPGQWNVAGHVLEAVDRHVDAAPLQLLVDGLDEQALPAELREVALPLVGLGLDRDHLGRKAWLQLLQETADVLGLGECHRRLAGADTERAIGGAGDHGVSGVGFSR